MCFTYYNNYYLLSSGGSREGAGWGSRPPTESKYAPLFDILPRVLGLVSDAVVVLIFNLTFSLLKF